MVCDPLNACLKIQFANILLMIFAFLFIGDIGIISFLVKFLSGFGLGQ